MIAVQASNVTIENAEVSASGPFGIVVSPGLYRYRDQERHDPRRGYDLLDGASLGDLQRGRFRRGER